MSQEPLQEPRPTQTIWGINPKDRIWFTVIAAGGGTAWTVAIVVRTITSPAADDPIWTQLLDQRPTIAGTYAAAGFAAWGLLNIKDGLMSIGDRVREGTAKRRKAIQDQARNEGIELGIKQGEHRAIKRLIARAEADGNQELVNLLKQEAAQNGYENQPSP